ncbi:A/G-specific adenine glycosylase [Caproicibacterium sp. BJN0003]|uniref:A/G-specific adenine glycosylase n=1 Tax=Caproicibacterium sp. BJN0003 TaxID=2994078 RepID=UPI00224C8555|nr:A/G-specific adenine glycosylase [Caproicibacterium sp. BJN0003]UZT81848.1 A/G-specific adenine glycosylase [Caproicibacterium sp. BJN0003]
MNRSEEKRSGMDLEERKSKDAIIESLPQILLPWFGKNARDLPWRHEITPYRVWVSEIMLQQTRVEAVKNYFIRFMKELPTVYDLAKVQEDQLLKLWEGLGYYSRVRNLQKAAIRIVEDYNGELPQQYESLLDLPGIGSYTAGAIASIAFCQPVPAVDGNVLRVLSRICADERDIADLAVKRDWEDTLGKFMPGEKSGIYNQALMELGAIVCVPNGLPKCEICPVKKICGALKQGKTGLLPFKSPKKPRKIEEKTVFLLERDDKIGLLRRPSKGLLAGLWELPNVPGTLTQEEAIEATRAWGVEPLRISLIGSAKHIFTHVEWHMTAYRIIVEQTCGMMVWASPNERSRKFALPSAFQMFLKEKE